MDSIWKANKNQIAKYPKHSINTDHFSVATEKMVELT